MDDREQGNPASRTGSRAEESSRLDQQSEVAEDRSPDADQEIGPEVDGTVALDEPRAPAPVRDADAEGELADAPPTVESVLGPPGPAVVPEVDQNLKAIVEALVFASPEPLTLKVLFKLLDNEPKEDVELALRVLQREYNDHRGLQFVEVAGGYQIVTRPELHEWVRRLFHERKTQKLTVQALETLAVIAYRQPITAPEIAEIRGVNTSGVLSTLLERHLIKIAGRKHVIGRPFLYATTREFLIRFGLRDLSDLPKIEDIADVLGFEAPAGLADTEPATGTLPLELEGEEDPGPETVN